jgi:hypothetical protein
MEIWTYFLGNTGQKVEEKVEIEWKKNRNDQADYHSTRSTRSSDRLPRVGHLWNPAKVGLE